MLTFMFFNPYVMCNYCFLACDCDLEGSIINDGERPCEVDVGQCTCKENIAGRKCDESATGFYGFPNPQGTTVLARKKVVLMQKSRGFSTCLFSSHAYFRDMIFQTIHKFLGFIFQNISYTLADFKLKLYLLSLLLCFDIYIYT